MKIQAAVMREAKAALTIETLDLDAPRPDEIVVKLVATGICHTDVGVLAGHIPFPPTPCVLGHEGAGIVEAIGRDVVALAPGDHVALSFSSCGVCDQCAAGHVAYCMQFFPANFLGRRGDGSCTHHQDGADIHAAFFGQSSFATHAIVRARDAVKLPSNMPLELAGPLGCGMQTGGGAVFNILKPKAGSSIAVFGAGAVGNAAIMAAKAAGCKTIIAVDIHRNRLDLALEIGATHAIVASDEVVKEIQMLTGGVGVNAAVEASGIATVVGQALEALSPLGTLVLLGVYPANAMLPVPLGALNGGRSIRTSTEGDSDPAIFIPKMVALYQDGKFPFDRLIRYYKFSEINEAIDDAASGLAIKPVIVFD